MKTAVIIVSLVAYFAIGYVASYKGLDLRRWLSWLYGAISFLCGLALGFSLTSDLIESLKAGAAFAFLTLVTGAAMRRHKQRYGGPG